MEENQKEQETYYQHNALDRQIKLIGEKLFMILDHGAFPTISVQQRGQHFDAALSHHHRPVTEEYFKTKFKKLYDELERQC